MSLHFLLYSPHTMSDVLDRYYYSGALMFVNPLELLHEEDTFLFSNGLVGASCSCRPLDYTIFVFYQ